MSSRKSKNKAAYKAKRAAHLKAKRREKVLVQLEGTVKMTREGYCFVIPEIAGAEYSQYAGATVAQNNGNATSQNRGNAERQSNRAMLSSTIAEVFVKSTKTHGALNGDRVRVDVTKIKDSKAGPANNGAKNSRANSATDNWDNSSKINGLNSATDNWDNSSKINGSNSATDNWDNSSKINGSNSGNWANSPQSNSKASRCEGVITEIIERSRKPFVGFMHIAGNQAWVLMQSKTMPYDIALTNWPKAAKQGYKVAAVVDEWPRGEINPVGHIVDVLGEPGANDTEMHAILAEYGLPYRFEPFVEKAADKISEEITPSDIKERKDFRKTLTFTIDPADAKDFDDALSFNRLRNGHTEVGVHIADVTHYVTPGTVIDKEAQERGTSVYLVDRTVPMLPEKLSNKLCSLRPGEDKLCFSAVFELDENANIVSEWFGRTIICSDRRFDYDQAQAIIKPAEAPDGIKTAAGNAENTAGTPDGVKTAAANATEAPNGVEKIGNTASDATDVVKTAAANATEAPNGVEKIGNTASESTAEAPDGIKTAASNAENTAGTPNGIKTAASKPAKSPDKVEQAMRELWTLAEKLRNARFAAGAISFERPEMKVICDEKGRPVDVKQKVSVEANWLIEEFMLLANRRVAQWVAVKCNNPTFVYRIHDEPNLEKLTQLRTFVRNFGYKMAPMGEGVKVSAQLNKLLSDVSGKPEASAIQLMGLRCMAKAKYDTENIGHYGLAFTYYTHFTSPIRRYPDMMVHRLLAQYLSNGKNADKDFYTQQCVHASQREQLAADAERSSVKYKLVEFMQDKVGYSFEGTVSGLAEWGMFIEVDPTHIEGAVPLRDIKSDFFVFDEEHYKVVGRRTHKVYTMGSRVKVKVTRADLDTRQLDFELIEG